MTQLAHLLRSDIRQFRWPLILWSALVAADTILMGARPGLAADVNVYARTGMVAGLLWFALHIAMLLLVPIVVQAHPAVGTDAFWMTRPMRPSAIFMSKLVLLGVTTVLLSCAARLFLMLWNGVPAGEALLVTLDTAISGTAWLALLMAGAAVTLNLPRFALLCGAAVALLALVMTLLIMQSQTRDSEATETLTVMSAHDALPPMDDPTPAVLFTLCAAVAGFALAAVQYRTRRRIVSVPVAVGGLVLAVLAIPHWPVPLLAVRSTLPAWTNQPGALQLRTAQSAITIGQPQQWYGGAEGPRMATLDMSVSGIEPGWLAGPVQLLGASLRLDDGRTLVSRRGYQSAVQIEGLSDPPWQPVARHVLGVEQVFGAPNTPHSGTTAFVLSPQHIAGLSEVHGRYQGDFAVRLEQWEVVAALPLRAGSTFDDHSYRFTVEAITGGPGIALSGRGRDWRATSSFDRKPQIAYRYFVRNRQRTRAMEGYASEPYGENYGFTAGLGYSFSPATSPYRFALRGVFMAFPMYGQQDQKIDWDPAWYQNAELVLVRVTERGLVKRTLEIPTATLVVQK